MTSEPTSAQPVRERGTGGAPGDGSRPPRLTRHPTDRVVAGLAGGLGAYFNVDPVVFRILFVVLSFAGGSGLLLYFIGWLVVPESEEGASQRPAAERWNGQVGTTVGIALIVVAGVLLVDEVVPVWDLSLWPLVLIGLGAFLLWQGRGDDGDGPPSAGGGGSTTGSPAVRDDRGAKRSLAASADAAGADTAAGPPAQGSGRAGGVPSRTVPSTPPPRERRPRSPLGRVTVGFALLVTGVAAFLDTVEAVDVGAVQYIALVVTTLGLGLVVGAWWGRARWLAIPALLLLPALAAASLAPLPLRGGVGERVHVPQAIENLDPDGYALLAGQLTLDLGEIALTDASIDVDASVGFGELTVLVPADAAVVVSTDVGAGQVDVFGRRSDGLGVDLRAEEEGSRGRVVLDLEVGFGEIRVLRSSSTPRPER